MAKDAVDLAVKGLGARVPPSCTSDLPLVGADGYIGFWNRRDLIAEQSGLHINEVEHLLSRHGTKINELLKSIRKRPGLAETLPGTKTYLCAEARYAASHEGALHIDDVLTRRTRISIETFDRGIEAAARVAREMGEVLGWDESTREREIEHYRLRVEAERESQRQPDDQSADAARLGAPDLRMGEDLAKATVVNLAERRGPAGSDTGTSD